MCTGKGAVLSIMHGARPDLDLSGYDYAAVASDHPAITLHGGQDCGSLNLPDGDVDCVSSQFGIEYVGAAATREAARILKPDGHFAMIAHHVDSVLVRANTARRDALAAFRASGLFERGISVAQGGVARDIDAIMAALAKTHAGQKVIADLFRALRQCVSQGLTGVPQIARLQTMAAAEQHRLDAMGSAALDEIRLRNLLAPIAALRPLTVAPLSVEHHGIIAWQVQTP